MIIEMVPGADRALLIVRLERMGFQVENGAEDKLAIVKGMDKLVQLEEFEKLPDVKKVHPLKAKFKLASRECKPENTVIHVKDKMIGDGSLFVIAGPCSIESEEQLRACAKAAVESGAQGLRGGAFKPRTSPYDFQGLGMEGIKLLEKVGKEFNLATVSEIMEPGLVEEVSKHIDILQVGARNMQNFNLLKELGKVRNPILLKRGFSATYQDVLMAAEYILSQGNPNVILCERGIRTFETHTRNTFDLNAVPALKELSHLPVIADPSHATGVRSLVAPMSRASVAAGADGVILEIHPDPDRSVSDAAQTLSLEAFKKLMKEMKLLFQTMVQFDD